MTEKTVTIEGSATPSAILGRGQRRTVAYTPRIKRLIARGFVVVVDDTPPSPPRRTLPEVLADPEPDTTAAAQAEPAPQPPAPPDAEPPNRTDHQSPAAPAPPDKPPAKNASREAWVTFLSAQPDIGNIPPGASRDDLAAAWEYLERRRSE